MTTLPDTDRPDRSAGWRLPLLAAMFGLALFVFARAVLLPNQKVSPARLDFVEAVPLPGWQSVRSEPVTLRPVGRESYLGGRRYYYRAGGRELIVQALLVSGTDGSVIDLERSRNGIGTKPEIRRVGGIGEYGLYNTDGSALLSACLLASGVSTFTTEQFKREVFMLQVGRVIPWLFARESFREKQCLWVHLTTRPERIATPTDKDLLERAWIAMSHGWRARLAASL